MVAEEWHAKLDHIIKHQDTIDSDDAEALMADLAACEAENARLPERWYSEQAMAAVVKERDYFEGCYNRWRGAVDISEHEGMAWKERAEKAEKALEYVALASKDFERQLQEEISHSKLAERERDKLQGDSVHATLVVADLIVQRDTLSAALEKMATEIETSLKRDESSPRKNGYTWVPMKIRDLLAAYPQAKCTCRSYHLEGCPCYPAPDAPAQSGAPTATDGTLYVCDAGCSREVGHRIDQLVGGKCPLCAGPVVVRP